MRRAGSGFPLYNINDILIRHISAREGEEMVAAGQAVALMRERKHGKDSQGRQERTYAYRLRFAVTEPAPGQPTIKVSEVEANAGLRGESRTARMTEAGRHQHCRVIRYADSGVEVRTPEQEDFVERAQGKVALWPLVGDELAPRVGPAPDYAAIERLGL